MQSIYEQKKLNIQLKSFSAAHKLPAWVTQYSSVSIWPLLNLKKCKLNKN